MSATVGRAAYAGGRMSSDGAEMSQRAVGISQTAGQGCAVRSPVSPAGLAEGDDPGRMSRQPGGMSGVRSAIDRGFPAGAHGPDADAPFPDQLLEDPVEGAAFGLIAEGGDYVAAGEVPGQAGQRRAEVAFHIEGAGA